MTMRKAGLLVLGALLAVGLAGCGDTLADRAQNREACESAGGVYVEYTNGFTYEYRGWNCDLSTAGATS